MTKYDKIFYLYCIISVINAFISIEGMFGVFGICVVYFLSEFANKQVK